MKIIMVGSYPLPNAPIKGGVESVTYNLMKGFEQYPEVQVIVLSFFSDRNCVLNLADNITIKYIKRKYRNMKLELLFNAKNILYTEYQETQSDIIHLQGSGSTLLLFDKKYKERIVVTQHSVLSGERKHEVDIRSKINYLLIECIEYWVKRKVSNWIFISEYNRKRNKKLLENNNNWRSIYNPVNPAYFLNNSITNNNTFYYVGRIGFCKGLVDFLKSMSIIRLSNRELFIDVIGGFEQNYEAIVKKQIAEGEIANRVSFHGWKESLEIIQIVKNSSFLILPSYQEVLPVVIAEAMAMGKVVISTNICGITEMVVDGQTGFLYKPGDITALSNIVNKVMGMPLKEIQEMGDKARIRATEMFSSKDVARKTIDFYKEIVCQEKQ